MDRLRLAICTAGELYGGVEQFVFTLALYISRETNVELTVVLWHKNKLYRKLREEGINVAVVGGKFKYDCRAVARLYRLFKTQGINVVHTNGYKANVLCALPAKLCGAKLIKTEHGRIEPRGLWDYKLWRMRLNLFMDEIVTRYLADNVIHVSSDLRSCFGRNGGVQRRSSVIYNGTPAISADLSATLPEIDRSIFNIGIVGRVSEVKGHRFLLAAMTRLQSLQNICVNVIGEGPLGGELKDYARTHGLQDAVRFLGFKENVLDYLAALDVLVIPSIHEGLPYVLLESMYLKVPVIASSVGGLAEILEDGVDSILVEPGNENELAEAIERLRTQPELRSMLAGDAWKKVQQQFTIDKMASAYLSLYASIPGDHEQQPK